MKSIYRLPSFIESFNLEFFDKFKVEKNISYFNLSASKNLYVIIGVSGSGKTTILKQLSQQLQLSINNVLFRTTTRKLRKTDEFMIGKNEEEFNQMRRQGKFFYTLFYEANKQQYAVEYEQIDKLKLKKNLYLLEDTPSLPLFKKFFPLCKSIVLLPNDKNALKTNLFLRKDKDKTHERLHQSIEEIKVIQKNIPALYDLGYIDHTVIVDNKLTKKLQKIIIEREKLKDHDKWNFKF